MIENVTALILDNGSSRLKAGFGGEDAPRSAQRNLVGRTRHPGVTPTILGNPFDVFAGDAAEAMEGLLSLTRPVQRGIVADWEALEASLQYHLIAGLQVASEEHPVLITEAPDANRADREKLVQLLFESFNFPAVCTASSSVLSLYATGRSTGLVVDSGAGKTHIGPVWEGYGLKHFLRRVDFGGDDLTAELQLRLRSEGYPFSTPGDVRVVERVKEEMLYVATNAEKEKAFSEESRSIERFYTLPDKQELYLNDARFMIPEVLFSPTMLAQPKPTLGWHHLIHETIELCDPAVRAELYSSIVLAGGNTLISRLDERVQKEVSMLAPKGIVTKCVAFPNRQYAAWVGGSMVASLSTFPSMWVNKSEYDDYGASIIHRKS